jgi:3-deoxy-manno-octulosonate cytidylyltransferase (CMP-KDO synthetase)
VPLLCIIPARLGSSRLPRKPLHPIAGDPLVVWVARRVTDWHLADRVVVATDATEIQAVVERAGFASVMTSDQHETGTSRIAEVIECKEFKSFDIILNVQGDEPLMSREAARGAVERVRGGDPIGTAAGPLEPTLAADPSRVKVVLDARGRAVYFSRAAIPFDRDGSGSVRYHQHIGVYAYTRDALRRWIALPPVEPEQVEKLEQLRPLLHGIAIGVRLLAQPPAPSVDTPEDVVHVERLLTRTLKGVAP